MVGLGEGPGIAARDRAEVHPDLIPTANRPGTPGPDLSIQGRSHLPLRLKPKRSGHGAPRPIGPNDDPPLVHLAIGNDQRAIFMLIHPDHMLALADLGPCPPGPLRQEGVELMPYDQVGHGVPGPDRNRILSSEGEQDTVDHPFH